METSINEIFQIQENPMANSNTTCGISSYISCIKLNGRPILPPLITEEKRRELNNYRKKAMEIECRLAESKQRSATFVKTNTVSTADNSLNSVSPNKQSTPARPITLQLIPNITGKTFILSSSESKTDRSYSDESKSVVKKDVNSNINISSDTKSSQKSTKSKKLFRSTLEQRIANEDYMVQNKRNIFEQSPIVEENYPLIVNEYADTDDSKKDRKSWSPLKIDTINSLRIELSNKDSQINDNLCVSMDDLENSSGTLTGSPNLMRQNSYTLLAPSPALLHYLENQNEGETMRRSNSGRKTWDLTSAKKNWGPNVTEDAEKLDKHMENQQLNKGKNSDKSSIRENFSSVDGFSVFQTSIIRNSSPNEQMNQNSFTDDGSTSPSSYSFRGNSPKFQKIKCKIKNRKFKQHRSVPSPRPAEQVPKFGSNTTQGPENIFVPSHIKQELTDLSNLLNKMKMEHERQKKELEEKQKNEIKELELIFKRRETELLQKIAQESPPCPRSVYSQYSDSRSSAPEFHIQMLGDGKHNSTDPGKYVLSHGEQGAIAFALEDSFRRPQSAKDFYTQTFLDHRNRRTRSMDFNQKSVANQDTDFDVSFQDSIQSKEMYTGNEDMIETDTISNFSSHSSTFSSDAKLESTPLLLHKKFKCYDVTSEEFQKFNQAAAVITAAARGFLTRRLLRTAHVQGLITTLRDAISCATQLHGATDLGESDVDLMKRLGRQIEAAWEAVYAVFFETDTSTKMQLISSDRERLRSISAKSATSEHKKRISSATLKSLRRRSGTELVMSKSQISNGTGRTRRIRQRMVASYPSPATQYKLK